MLLEGYDIYGFIMQLRHNKTHSPSALQTHTHMAEPGSDLLTEMSMAEYQSHHCNHGAPLTLYVAYVTLAVSCLRTQMLISNEVCFMISFQIHFLIAEKSV